MDRKILLRQLVQAEQDVAEGKAFIAEQQRLIVASERDGCHDTAETMRLLDSHLGCRRKAQVKNRSEPPRQFVMFVSETKAWCQTTGDNV
jgi:hypothetical protein